MTAFQEKWPWNKELLKYFLIIPTAAGVVLTIILYFFIGINSFWFLCSILIGLMLGFMYGYVGKKVEQLKNRFKDDEGEVVESLTVIQKYESPGIVILRKEELVVINILNRRATISLNKKKIHKLLNNINMKNFAWRKCWKSFHEAIVLLEFEKNYFKVSVQNFCYRFT